MTREEAIKIVRNIYQTDAEKKALAVLVPELKEGEDERIRKELIEFIQWSVDRRFMREDFHQAKRPSEWITYLEKQQEASKAIKAVERIDKYIDENLANAHDMKDSNPDKKYYRGWDDALGEMARILQDVYSGEKQKESLRDFIDDFPYSNEQKEQEHICDSTQYEEGFKTGLEIGLRNQKEQKPAHTAKEMWKEMRLEVYAQASGNRHEPNCSDNSTKMFSLYDIDEIFEKIGNTAVGLQPTEWSEEDEKIRQSIIEDIEFTRNFTEATTGRVIEKYNEQIAWLKAHPLNLKKKNEDAAKLCSNEWSEEDERLYKCVLKTLELWAEGKLYQYIIPSNTDRYIDFFKSLKFRVQPQPKQKWSEEDIQRIRKEEYTKGFNDAAFGGKAWKPSEEQMEALDKAISVCMVVVGRDEVAPLKSLLQDLKKRI